MRIAVLDDDPMQVEFAVQTLTAAGHVCLAFTRGGELLRQLRRETFDLLVLDWSVPDMPGDQVLGWVRQNLPLTLPVLFMTNRGHETDIAQMLNEGADDYIVKPVSGAVMLARVEALLRRAYRVDTPAQNESFDGYVFDLQIRQVLVNRRPVSLTQKEFDLALMLFHHLGRPLSRAHILDMIWKQTEDLPSRTMDTHISVLRTKLNLRPENGYRLVPIYGYGYRLEKISENNRPERESESENEKSAQPD